MGRLLVGSDWLPFTSRVRVGGMAPTSVTPLIKLKGDVLPFSSVAVAVMFIPS